MSELTEYHEEQLTARDNRIAELEEQLDCAREERDEWVEAVGRLLACINIDQKEFLAACRNLQGVAAVHFAKRKAGAK